MRFVCQSNSKKYVIRNLYKFCMSSIFISFAAAVGVFPVLCNYALIHIKKPAYALPASRRELTAAYDDESLPP